MESTLKYIISMVVATMVFVGVTWFFAWILDLRLGDATDHTMIGLMISLIASDIRRTISESNLATRQKRSQKGVYHDVQ